MKNLENSAAFEAVLKEAKKKNADPEKLATLLLDLREALKNLEDPLVTKVLRLAAQHLQTNGSFELADQFEDGLPDDESNLAYFVHLIADSQNKFNREELQEFKNILSNG